MPQMSPINWLILMIYFIGIFFYYNVLNYYIYLPKINAPLKNFNKKKSMNWKW